MAINTDRVVSLSAMLIGLGSLFIIVFQTGLLREQQTVSALPDLTMGLQTNSESTHSFARSTGAGPALIEDVDVRYQGRELRQEPFDFFLGVRDTDRHVALRERRALARRLGQRRAA